MFKRMVNGQAIAEITIEPENVATSVKIQVNIGSTGQKYSVGTRRAELAVRDVFSLIIMVQSGKKRLK